MDKSLNFSKDELKTFFLTSFLISVIIFLFTWRTTDFSIISGISFFIMLLLFSIFLNLLIRSLQKYWAKKKGYETKYRNSWKAQVITTAISLFSFGALPLLAPGEIVLTHNPINRLGKFRYGHNLGDDSAIASIPPVISIIMVFILKFFYTTPEETPLTFSLILLGLLYAFFSLLPIPSYEGVKILAWSRLRYVFLIVFVVFFGALVILTNYFSLIIALLVAIVVSGIFLKQVEKI